VQLGVGSGTLAASDGAGVTVGNSGSATILLTGTLADINAYLASAAVPVYLPVANANGPVTLTMHTDDAGNTGAGGALSDTDMAVIPVIPVNDAPVNTLPAAGWSTNEDTGIALTGLSVSDVDAASGTITVQLRVDTGTLTAAHAAGVVVARSGTSSILLTGTLSDINAYLASASAPVYVPLPNANGTATLTMLTNDLGNTGAGGPLTDSDSRGIAIASVNDAPVAANDTAAVASGGSVDVGAAAGLLANDSDVDGDHLSIASYTVDGLPGPIAAGTPADIPGVGVLTINADGSYSFVPASGFSGSVPKATYTVSDGEGGTATGELALTVLPALGGPEPPPEVSTFADVPVANNFVFVLQPDFSTPGDSQGAFGAPPSPTCTARC
jgi:hypothetical protein